MARWTPQKKDVLDALAGEILHNYGKGRTIVAVDGIDGAGKKPFADDLAAAITRAGHSVFRASMGDFHKPRADRYARGIDSAEGYYQDSFNYSVFRRVLIDPFRMGGSTGFVTEAFDVARDAVIESNWKTAPQDAMLIIDGAFLNRPELRGLWNYSLWLEVPAVAAKARMEELDGPAGLSARYKGAQKLYEKDAKPSAAATATIDNADPEHPRRAFADSC
jgi:uridine kinase